MFEYIIYINITRGQIDGDGIRIQELRYIEIFLPKITFS